MVRNRIRWICMIGLAVVFAPPQRLQADPPSILSIFKSKKTQEDYQLKDIHGPWMIYATSFAGEESESKAIELAKEIRQELKLPTFVYAKSFDYSKPLGSETVFAEGRSFRVRPLNESKSFGYAVLVGEFPSDDNEAAQEALEKIKYAQPASLQGKGADSNGDNKIESNEMVSAYKRWIWGKTKDDKRKSKGPMGSAFITKNPLLPEEFFQAPKIDKFVENMNRSVEYSLLQCKGRFTVRVATFQGGMAIAVGDKATDDGQELKNKNLEIAAARANRMVTKLRAKGVEAYEFHDRYSSYVTIGSFDSLGRSTPDGGFEYDPGIIDVMSRYCGAQKIEQTQYGAAPVPLTIDNIPFDLEARPMAVPRPEARSIYAGSLLGK